MAITVTPDLILINNCDADNWSAGDLDTDMKIQGTGCIGDFVDNELGTLRTYTIPTAVDMSNGEHIYVWMLCFGLVDTVANGGYRIYAADSSANNATWWVGGNDTHGTGWQLLIADVNATPDESTGTLDTSDIKTVGVRFKTITDAPVQGANEFNNCYWDVMRYGKGLIITSGATDGITIADIHAVDTLAANKYGVIIKEGDVYFVQGKLTFGDSDGTDEIDFDDSNQVIIFKDSDYYAGDFNGIEILGNSTGVTNFVMGEKVGTQGIAGCFNKSVHTDTSFEVTITDTDIDVLKLYGSTFINSDTIGLLPTASGVEVLNTNFTSCGMIVPDTITFANCFVIDSFDNIALEIGSTSHNVSNTTFIDNTYAVSISGGAGEYDFDQLYFENSATKDLFVAVTSGVVTINVLNGGDTPTYDTAGATVVINNAVNITIHVIDESGNNIENAQVAVYQTSGDTELMNEDTLSTGIATETFNFETDTAIYWRVRKSSTGTTRYFPRNGTGTITSAGFSATITLAEDTIII